MKLRDRILGWMELNSHPFLLADMLASEGCDHILVEPDPDYVDTEEADWKGACRDCIAELVGVVMDHERAQR